jgi:serine/threonine protein kinase
MKQGDGLDEVEGSELIDVLAEEFASRCRAGERPSIDEFAERNPDLAPAIRRLFPAIAFLEGGKHERRRSAFGSGERRSVVPVLPQKLGENTIVREIGRGGMGVVYEATQHVLGRRVAVKVLLGHATANVTSRERFLRESRAVARLQHPNIVPIYSIGEDGGIPYFVMALINGPGLDRPIELESDRNAQIRKIVRLGIQAAEALAFAHDQGVLHRDIKPANLLLDATGKVWLVDFGLARLADDLSITSTGDLPGTLRYLAPECLDNDGDARSDVYSLGLTLYELLLGRPGFAETNRVRLLRQIHDGIPEAPRKIDPSFPPDLETILLKSIAREPERRYKSAHEFAEDLARFLDGRPILARRVGVLEQMSRWLRRNPAVAALSLTSLILGVIAAYFLTLYLIRPPARFPGDPRPGPLFRRFRPRNNGQPPPPPPLRRFD